MSNYVHFLNFAIATVFLNTIPGSELYVIAFGIVALTFGIAHLTEKK